MPSTKQPIRVYVYQDMYCSHCMIKIYMGQPVYMGWSKSFCTFICRKRYGLLQI